MVRARDGTIARKARNRLECHRGTGFDRFRHGCLLLIYDLGGSHRTGAQELFNKSMRELYALIIYSIEVIITPILLFITPSMDKWLT